MNIFRVCLLDNLPVKKKIMRMGMRVNWSFSNCVVHVHVAVNFLFPQLKFIFPLFLGM